MTSPPRGNGPMIALATLTVVLGIVIIGGIVVLSGRYAGSSGPAPAGVGTTPALAPVAPERLRVADLMARAGCAGSVIGTQLYSYETGRCQMPGGEVTIAVFDTAELRDQWVSYGRQFGGTIVIGEGWAAGVASPDAATALASALGGRLA